MLRNNYNKNNFFKKKSVLELLNFTSINFLRNQIKEILLTLGFTESGHLLDNFSDKIFPANKISLAKKEIKNLEANILKLLINQLIKYHVNNKFIALVEMMQQKSTHFACESAIKLALYCNDEILNEMYDDFFAARNFLDNSQNNINQDDIKSSLGYILSLNLNKYSYIEMVWYSLTYAIKFKEKFLEYKKYYADFILLDKNSAHDPGSSLNRRRILNDSGLLQTHLQRDPEEVKTYESRMISAKNDKARLIESIRFSHDKKCLLIDVGPAGCAILKAAIELAAENYPHLYISYCGIEFDKNELIQLNKFIENFTYHEMSAQQLLEHCIFVNGNAIYLYDLLSSLPDAIKTEEKYLSIVLCSVIHEIYSYCRFESEISHCNDVISMTPAIDNQYNLESVYTVYYQALKSIAENPASGSLNVRDGVMYQYPKELVTFSIQDARWLDMFKYFVQDRKYSHLLNTVDIKNIQLNMPITLEAKYVQEFMLKANWGSRPFGNEINEVYCYMTRFDHEKLLQRAAQELNIAIKISSEEYIQDGYKNHIDENKIKIINGFGDEKFPPTNMILKVQIAEPVMEHTLRQSLSY